MPTTVFSALAGEGTTAVPVPTATAAGGGLGGEADAVDDGATAAAAAEMLNRMSAGVEVSFRMSPRSAEATAAVSEPALPAVLLKSIGGPSVPSSVLALLARTRRPLTPPPPRGGLLWDVLVMPLAVLFMLLTVLPLRGNRASLTAGSAICGCVLLRMSRSSPSSSSSSSLRIPSSSLSLLPCVISVAAIE